MDITIAHNHVARPLIPLQQHNDAPAVLGRDLHEFLEVKVRYNDWFPRMIEYGFVAGQDYVLKNEYVLGGNNRQYEQSNHVLTLDMAKEVAMIQRTDKGKQARRYFIECEKQAKQAAPALTEDEIVHQALAITARKVEALEARNQELEPKAEAYESFMEANGKYSVGEVAKMLGMGQNKLFRELRNAKILISKGHLYNTPYQQYMHHFEVKARTIVHTNGQETVKHTTYVQPSGIDFIARKLNVYAFKDVA